MNNLKENYAQAVIGYIEAFEKKHDLTFTNIINLEVLEFGDYYIEIGSIKFDIDSQQPKKNFFKWYDESLEKKMKNKYVNNYQRYCNDNNLQS